MKIQPTCNGCKNSCKLPMFSVVDSLVFTSDHRWWLVLRKTLA